MPKGSVWVQYDGRIVPSPMFVGKDGKDRSVSALLMCMHSAKSFCCDCHVSRMTVLAIAEPLSSYGGTSPGYVGGAGYWSGASLV